MAALGLAVLLVRDVRRLDWLALGRAFQRWPEWAQILLTVGLTGLLWATAQAPGIWLKPSARHWIRSLDGLSSG